jgi:hypothetical protein
MSNEVSYGTKKQNAKMPILKYFLLATPTSQIGFKLKRNLRRNNFVAHVPSKRLV